jgi:hypothetical protein
MMRVVQRGIRIFSRNRLLVDDEFRPLRIGLIRASKRVIVPLCWKPLHATRAQWRQSGLKTGGPGFPSLPFTA